MGELLLKMQGTAVQFHLGYQKHPWFGPAGSENKCVFS
jgi:hypothetical protein